MREKAAQNKTPPSQRKEQYTQVEIDTGSEDTKRMDSATESESSGDGAFSHKEEVPTSSCSSQPSTASENRSGPKRKPLPPPPAKKPRELQQGKPQTKMEDVSTLSGSLIDRMNQPLPPTPGAHPEPTPLSSRGCVNSSIPSSNPQHRDTSSHPQATGKALMNEIMAKRGKGKPGGVDLKSAPKKQVVPTPKQRPGNKQSTDGSKSSTTSAPSNRSLPADKLHEPAGYANLPAHDTPYQNVGFGPDSSTSFEEQGALYENVHKSTKSTVSGNTQTPKRLGHTRVEMNGSGRGSDSGAEYQNVNASRRPSPRRK